MTPLVELWEYFYTNDVEEILNYVISTVNKNQLSKTDSQKFKIFRDNYNQQKNRNPLDLYILTCFSFNNYIRFNNDLQFNMGFGMNRSNFNNSLEKKLITSISTLQKKECSFQNKPFNRFEPEHNQFIYIDPPYLLTTATYNDGKRGFGGWNMKHERMLYTYLENLIDKDILFGLSNILTKDNRTNHLLTRFINENELMVHRIKSNYNNCSHNKKKAETVEVYVTNT